MFLWQWIMASTPLLLFMLAVTYMLPTFNVAAIPLENFYPYGSKVGDNFLGRIDEGFGATDNDTIKVNNNGFLLIVSDNYNFTALYVYCSNVDTRVTGGGFVWYRNTSSPDLLQRALTDVHLAYPSALDLDIDFLFIVTWYHVGQYPDRTDKKNTFQCVLALSGDNAYAIYLYADGLIQWSSQYCTGPVGYRDKDGVLFLLPNSRPCNNLNVTSVSNVDYPGMLVFKGERPHPVFVPECDKGDVRLVCGINNRTGQVEICHKNLWNSVSHYNWGLEEAMVACRHLGLPNDGQIYIGQSLEYAASGVTISCASEETRLNDCRVKIRNEYRFTRAARMTCLTKAEANECEKNVGTTDKFVSNSTEKEADSSSLCYNRYGFCVPFISQRYLSRYGVPCDKVYEEGIDYVFIQSNKTFNYYELWSSISKVEDIIEEDSNKQCNKKINRMICHYYIPPCGNSTLFVPPTSVCSDACEQLKQTYSYQWRVFQNTVNKQWFDPLTCNDTGKILDPLPYSCSNIGVYNLSDDNNAEERRMNDNAIIASTTSAGITVVLLIVIASIFTLCLAVRRWKSTSIIQKHMSEGEVVKRYKDVEHYHDIIMESTTEKVISGLYHEMEQKHQLIPSSHIDLRDSVGQGEFGIVYRAILDVWRGEGKKQVAVKTLKGLFSATDLKNLVEESMIMSNFNHPNVMKLIGVCIDSKGTPYIVMPYMTHGSLLSYLRKNREHLSISTVSDDDNLDLASEGQRTLLSMCLQIAKGMTYLAGENFVHRDLATRNCMIDENFVIKVADFGLSEDIYSKNYFRQVTQEHDEAPVKLPVRWMALESLNDGIFNEKTDVWSFGVTCWEVFTLGKHPYPGIHPLSLIRYLERGERLDKPLTESCSHEIYGLMMSCWNKEQEKRPAFSELVTDISTILEGMAGYLELTPFAI